MNESVCDLCWTNNNYCRYPRNNRAVFFEGSQGSGKTTLARLTASSFGIEARRGFPSGVEIIGANGNQSYICNNAFEKVYDQRKNSLTVFDRSPISQAAYLTRTKGKEYIPCVNNIVRCLQLSSFYELIFFFIDASPEICFRRQDNESKYSLQNISEFKTEREVYKQIVTHLTHVNSPNLGIYYLNNGFENKVDDLHQQVLKIIENNKKYAPRKN